MLFVAVGNEIHVYSLTLGKPSCGEPMLRLLHPAPLDARSEIATTFEFVRNVAGVTKQYFITNELAT
jgi:hypothetical protein